MSRHLLSRRRLMFVAGVVCISALPVPGFSKSQVYTPAKGSAERAALMDAMRAKGDDQDRVFVVRHLKVSGDWAWLDCAPQSRDGRNKYEPESALFQKKNARWRVAAQPCGEADCEYGAELTRIRVEYPAAPDAIFP